jgi:hypothetical protein
MPDFDTCSLRDCDEPTEVVIVAENILGPDTAFPLCGLHADQIRTGREVPYA